MNHDIINKSSWLCIVALYTQSLDVVPMPVLIIVRTNSDPVVTFYYSQLPCRILSYSLGYHECVFCQVFALA
jgi:hypothetical protein